MSDSLTEAAANVVEGLPNGESPPEAVQVELPAEPGSAEGGEQPASAEPPKKQGRPARERIVTLTQEKSTLMQELETERRRSSELAASLQQRDVDLAAGHVRQMELHKARLTSEAEQARQAFKAASTAQDADQLAEATARLARSESGLADVEAWEARNKAAPQQQTKPSESQPQQQQFQQPPPIDAATGAWMGDNPWFQPLINGRANPDFDKSMHLTAVAYASRLEDRMKAEGRQNQIAGPEYWSEINDHMAREFPDRYDVTEEQEEQSKPQQRQSSPVAPATRSQPQTSGTRAAPNGKVIAQLSGQERAMADSLRRSGSLLYPRDPNIPREKWGQRMSEQDAWKAYAEQIRRDKADQAQRRANQ